MWKLNQRTPSYPRQRAHLAHHTNQFHHNHYVDRSRNTRPSHPSRPHHQITTHDQPTSGSDHRVEAHIYREGVSASRLLDTIANYLAQQVDDRIDRKVLAGAGDTGDIVNMRHMGRCIVVRTKGYGGCVLPGQWGNEAHTEMGNDNAPARTVVANRRAVNGLGSQWALMTHSDLAVLD